MYIYIFIYIYIYRERERVKDRHREREREREREGPCCSTEVLRQRRDTMMLGTLDVHSVAFVLLFFQLAGVKLLRASNNFKIKAMGN